jgi:DNA-binding protein HU-beta
MRKTALEGPCGGQIAKNRQKTLVFSVFFLYNAFLVSYHRIDKRRDRTFPHRFVFSKPYGSASECAVFFQIKRREIGRLYMAEVKKMTQTAIVRELAETTGVNNKVSKHYLESLTELAIRETKKNGVFILPGIGRLVRAERKARVGRNPATGEAIKIPAKKVVKFRIAKSVKDAIVPPKVAKK